MMSSLKLMVVAVSAVSTVVLTLVAPRRAQERRLARLRPAQERWAATMDRR